MPADADQPKIIIDSDWKSQAQAEKERLAEKEQHEAAGPGGPDGLPPADFRGLLGSLATQALLYMGAYPDPETGRALVALDYAKHYIDLMGVLEAKTKGNLSPEEQEEMSGVLQELRMRFVQLAGMVEKAQREGTMGRAPAGQGPAGPMSGGLGTT